MREYTTIFCHTVCKVAAMPSVFLAVFGIAEVALANQCAGLLYGNSGCLIFLRSCDQVLCIVTFSQK